jgi:hypothetical protein
VAPDLIEEVDCDDDDDGDEFDEGQYEELTMGQRAASKAPKGTAATKAKAVDSQGKNQGRGKRVAKDDDDDDDEFEEERSEELTKDQRQHLRPLRALQPPRPMLWMHRGAARAGGKEWL